MKREIFILILLIILCILLVRKIDNPVVLFEYEQETAIIENIGNSHNKIFAQQQRAKKSIEIKWYYSAFVCKAFCGWNYFKVAPPLII